MTFPKVLIVDDDASVSRALIRCLRTRCELDCTVVSSGVEALGMLLAHPFDLLVTDATMPGMSGIELLRIAAHRWPSMRRALFTGYYDLQNDGADAVLAKGGSVLPICDAICKLARTPRGSEPPTSPLTTA